MRIQAVVVAAVFVALGAFAMPAMAADPALVAAFDRTITPLERATLAAILTIPANDAEFDADMREAQKDAASLALAHAKWRLRMAEFSRGDRTAPNPNLDGAYRTYPEILSPPIRAYLARRLRDLRTRGEAGDVQAKEAFETLRDYLASVQASLIENDGTLSWYAKRVVSGIMDKYRSELVEFLGTENARKALRDGPGAVTELARRRAAAQAIQDAARAAVEERRRRVAQPRKDPVVPPKDDGVLPTLPKPEVQPVVPGVIETDAQRTAREQAEAAERLARIGKPGEVFDGGLVVGPDATVVPGDGATGRRDGLSVPAPGPGNLTGPRVEPPAMSDSDILLESIKGPRGTGKKSWKENMPTYAGAALGALIGFFLGGPIGAIIGAVLGAGAGVIGAKLLFK